MVRIFVGNLGAHYSEAVLRSVFETFGAVEDVSIADNCAFVLMHEEAAHRAISTLSNTSWFLRPFFVRSVGENAA